MRPFSKPEKIAQRKFAKYVRVELELPAVKINVDNYKSFPDLLVLAHKGKAIWFEFKKVDKEPTELQLRKHKELRALGFKVFVVDNFLDAKEKLNSVID